MSRTLDNNSDVEYAINNMKDLKVTGDGNMFQLLYKVSSKQEDWMKSTKAMEIRGVGCLVQVTTQQGNHIAEALTFIPGVQIINDINGGKRLVII